MSNRLKLRFKIKVKKVRDDNVYFLGMFVIEQDGITNMEDDSFLKSYHSLVRSAAEPQIEIGGNTLTRLFIGGFEKQTGDCYINSNSFDDLLKVYYEVLEELCKFTDSKMEMGRVYWNF